MTITKIGMSFRALDKLKYVKKAVGGPLERKSAEEERKKRKTGDCPIDSPHYRTVTA